MKTTVKLPYLYVVFLLAQILNLQYIKGISPANSVKYQIDSLFSLWNNQNSPGATVAVIKDGKIVFEKGYGMANLEYGVANTPQTKFHIASVSKQFTALAILLLAQENKLSLEDDIRKYLPELFQMGKPIKIKHLIYHTSGLREPIYLLGMAGWNLDDVLTREQIFKILCRQKSLNFEPGTNFMYVNTGYMLLAEIVARVSGEPFAVFVKKRIFEPLHMTHSSVTDDYLKIVTNKAYSYSSDGTGEYRKRNLNLANIVGSTGILTTVEDLSLWTSNFEHPIVGNTSIIKKMCTNGTLDNGDTLEYACGQFIRKYKGLNIIEHGGSDAGFRCHFLRFPDQRLSIVVLGNDASLNADRLAHQIADIYLGKNISAAPSPESIEETSLRINTDSLKRYEGKFELQPGFFMDFFQEGNNLSVNATGQGVVPLIAVAPTVFKIRAINATITFLRDDTGNYDKFQFNMNDRSVEGKRIKYQMSDSVLDEYCGKFYSEELNTTYSIVKGNKMLVINHSRGDDSKLIPIGGDTFAGNQWFLGQIEFIRNNADKITCFQASTERVHNIRFDKID